MHKILLNSVCCLLLSLAVSDQHPRDKHPLGRNPSPSFLSFVGRLGSRPHLVGWIGSAVRVSVSFQQKNTRRVLSYDVPRQQKMGVMTEGLTSLRLRRITSNPSQTLRRPLVRTTATGAADECSTLAAVRRGFVFHTSPLVRLTTL